MRERAVTQDARRPDRATVVKNFARDYQPPTETIQHFESIPWTKSWMTDPKYTITPFWSRHEKPGNSEDFFFARTINTESTIPHTMVLCHRFGQPPEVGSGDIAIDESTPDLVVLLQLGEKGLDGHPSIIHGGVTCALLDEMQSEVILMYRRLIGGDALADALFTANLDVNYRAPVPTPGACLVKCWLVSRDKRKWKTKAKMVDGDGKLLAEGAAIWVVKPREKI
ncbi:hypothetical protein B0A52_08653 [Exophiala mesophila]|uniref:Thioesterase domain-containing protein n=1 Tax=Exophiala mesophila TaxID=212818 RepID=A0A438MU71_EXOME|nr:hypothetical protein B0A52_08653 [Exophiala mesophila]